MQAKWSFSDYSRNISINPKWILLIRRTFNIQNDFTPEEEDQIRRENEWAEE
jgi:hypothetical protein